MNTRKFWPLDLDMDGEIYENPAWDLPGHRPRGSNRIDSIKVRRSTPSKANSVDPA